MRLSTSMILLLTATIVSVSSLAGTAQAETLWIHATDAEQLSGPIAFGQTLGIADEKAIGDFLLPTLMTQENNLYEGSAEYRVKIPKAGTYYIWARLRYPSGLDESFALLPAGGKPSLDIRLAIGKGKAGVRKWHWAGRAKGVRRGIELPAGNWSFSIYPREALEQATTSEKMRMTRPMFCPRLNAICLTTDADYVPNDADARIYFGQSLSVNNSASRKASQPIRLRRTNLPPVSDEELRLSGKRRIPDWLRCPRFYTKDSHRHELSHRQPGDIKEMARHISANGASAFRLSVCWGGEVFYQSKVAPHAPGLGKLDFLREAVDEGRRLSLKVVAYINPNALYLNHPLFKEAAIRDANGEIADAISYNRFKDTRYACINNPKYRKFLSDVVTEIFTEYGPDGLYVDGLSAHRCFCKHCRAKYEQMWGDPMPVAKFDVEERHWGVLWEMTMRPTPVGRPDDRDDRRYTQFLYKSSGEVKHLIAGTVRRCKPGAAVIIHNWPKPNAVDCYDATLTEIFLNRPWLHTLWKSGELANYSNNFSVPVLFNIYLRKHATEAEGITYSVQGLANGCFPNCWSLVSMRRMFGFMREHAAYYDFLRTAPTRFMMMPRSIRLDTSQRLAAANAKQIIRPKRELFLTSYVGMYSAVIRGGLPIVLTNRYDFHRRLDGFKVLSLANEACMSDEQASAVRQFVESGGGLIATHQTSLYDENGRQRKDFALADLFGAHYRKTLNPEKTANLRFDKPHPVTDGLGQGSGIVNDDVFVSVELDAEKDSAAKINDRQVLAWFEDGGVKSKKPAVIVNRFGRGRIVYFPGRPDARQCQELSGQTERLFRNAVNWAAAGDVPVRIKSPGPVATTLFDQPDRRILHLVNLNGDSKHKCDIIEPLENVGVELILPAGRRLKRLHRLWDKGKIDYKTAGRRITFRLDRIGPYEAVVAELDM